MRVDAQAASEKVHGRMQIIIQDEYPNVKARCQAMKEERDALRKGIDRIKKKLSQERKVCDLLLEMRADFIEDEDVLYKEEVKVLQNKLNKSEIEYKRIKNEMRELMNDLSHKSSELESKSSLLREADEILQNADCAYEATVRWKNEEKRREEQRSCSQIKYIEEIQVQCFHAPLQQARAHS